MLLAQIQPNDLCDSHLHHLLKLCKVDFTESRPQDLIAEAWAQRLQFWDFNSGRGILLTQILVHGGGKELFIFGLAGEGMAVKVKQIWATMHEYAQYINARWMGANVVNERLERIFLSLSAKKVATRFLVEV